MMMAIFILAVCFFLVFVLSDQLTPETSGQAIAELQEMGHTNIEILDESLWLGRVWTCGKVYNVRFTFRAKEPTGKEVEGYLCTGGIFRPWVPK